MKRVKQFFTVNESPLIDQTYLDDQLIEIEEVSNLDALDDSDLQIFSEEEIFMMPLGFDGNSDTTKNYSTNVDEIPILEHGSKKGNEMATSNGKDQESRVEQRQPEISNRTGTHSALDISLEELDTSSMTSTKNSISKEKIFSNEKNKENVPDTPQRLEKSEFDRIIAKGSSHGLF